MRALVLLTLFVAARAGYYAPALGARFSYGYTAAAPAYGYAGAYAAPLAHTYASAPVAHAYAAPVAATYAAAPVAHTYAAPVAHAVAAPVATSSQHHAQDEFGQYNYGYADVNSAKNEVKTADGVVRGSYSYLDSYGIQQKVDYVADAYGYRAAGTNLPVGPAQSGLVGPAPVVDTPEVAAAKAAHFAAHADALAHVGRKKRSLAFTTPAATYLAPTAYNTLHHGYGYAAAPAVAPLARAFAAPLAATYAAAPVAATYAAAPVAATYAAAPVAHAVAAPVSTSSQHHAQDEFGQYNYGYADVNSAKNEVKTADGVVRGSYSYVDSYGLPQKVDYVSDAYGYRAAGTNLPVGPAQSGLVGPAPVVDTPEVAAAKAAHFAAHADALARSGH